MNKLVRLLICITIPLVLVGCSTSTPISSSGLSASANPSDMSTTYLTMIFGSMGHVLIGNGNQLVGMLFKVFNYSIISLTSLFLIYNVFTMMLGGVMEGSLQGKNGKHSLLIMRIVLGVVFMVPSPSSGYSIAQELVMEGTLAGINLANTVWSSVLDFVSEGHVLWDVPGENSPSITDIILGQKGDEVTGDVYQSFMLANGGNKPDSSSWGPTDSLAYYVLNAEMCSMSASNSTIITPKVITDNDQNATTKIGFKDSIGGDAGCGSINWSLINSSAYNEDGEKNTSFCLDPTEGTDQLYCEDGYNAISAVVADLMPAAAQLACTDDDSLSGCSSVDTAQNQSIVAAGIAQAQIDYATNVYAIFDGKNSTDASSSSGIDDMVDDAESNGWLMAGRFYYLLADLQLNDDTTLDSFGTSYATQSSAFLDTNQTSMTNTSLGDMEDAMGYDAIGDFSNCSDDDSSAACLLYNYATAMDSTIQSTSATSTKTKLKLSGVAATWFSCGASAINDIIDFFGNASDSANPITFLVGLGSLCLSSAAGMWEGMLTYLGIAGGFAAGLAPGYVGAIYVLKVSYKWAVPILLVMMGLLVSCGASLFYYLPLYPFILFIMACVGWFISVIEAMVAVPLVAYGLTSPDGNHDLLGRGEQSIMLFLSVIFRPVLMIIGLIVGMVLAFAAFSLLNHTFASFINDLYRSSNMGHDSVSLRNALDSVQSNLENVGGKHTGDDMLVSLITTPMFLTVFATIAIEVTHQCYALIHQLPEYVLRWIGGPQGAISNMIDKSMANIKEVESNAGQAASNAISSSASGFDKARSSAMGQVIGSTMQKRKQEQKQQEREARDEGILQWQSGLASAQSALTNGNSGEALAILNSRSGQPMSGSQKSQLKSMLSAMNRDGEVDRSDLQALAQEHNIPWSEITETT